MSLLSGKAASIFGLASEPSTSISVPSSFSRPPTVVVPPPMTTTTSTSGESDGMGPGGNAGKGLDVTVLKQLAKNALVESLNSIQGAKTLVLDPSLAGPLGLITDFSLFKHQAVDKMFWLEEGPLRPVGGIRNIVYLCRPKRRFMKIIADQIKAHQLNASDPSSSASNAPSSSSHTYTIIFAPRRTTLCLSALEQFGVSGDVTTVEFPLEFIPLEEDLISLEMGSSSSSSASAGTDVGISVAEDFVNRDVFLKGDESAVYEASRALMTFQRVFGLIPKVYSKGRAALHLRQLLSRHRYSDPALYGDLEPSEQVDGLIILDRAVDWVTPMLTQLTYEGLLDEYVGIENSHIEIDASLLTTQPIGGASASAPTTGSTISTPTPPKKKKHLLSSSTDRLYGDLRDRNFATVGSRLSRTARKLEGEYEERKRLKSVKEMKDFVGKLGGLQSEHQGLRLHTALSEMLMPITHSDEFNKALEIQQNLLGGYDNAAQLTSIEDLLNQGAPLPVVLRALVLYSLTNSGVRPKYLEAIKREFLQVYGYHHLPLLINLESLGLLTKYPAQQTAMGTTLLNWPAVRKGFKLLSEEVDERSPRDISYVYSGYAPLSCRLVQIIAQRHVFTADVTTASSRRVDGREANTPPGGSAGPDEGADSDAPPGESSGKEKMRAHPLAGWGDWQGLVDSLPGGPAGEEKQEAEGESGKTASRVYQDTPKTTVVFFLGGCTSTEVAALRFMSRQTKGRRFLIATTGMINGTELLREFGQPDPVILRPSAPAAGAAA